MAFLECLPKTAAEIAVFPGGAFVWNSDGSQFALTRKENLNGVNIKHIIIDDLCTLDPDDSNLHHALQGWYEFLFINDACISEYDSNNAFLPLSRLKRSKSFLSETIQCGIQLTKFIKHYLGQDHQKRVEVDARCRFKDSILNEAVKAFKKDRLKFAAFHGEKLTIQNLEDLLDWNQDDFKHNYYRFVTRHKIEQNTLRDCLLRRNAVEVELDDDDDDADDYEHEYEITKDDFYITVRLGSNKIELAYER
ncbi:hypothetical protein L596_026707 [Steinernema carpocapsae]|uniref:Uncharacterized protein n=1 Tax=Steinernema carpocapsae TaxID=34508 RepID=A0A4U5M272_STECR|nr:hypothetical protein L596_026707 [Steinernema carpocapsae]